eukprot:9501361-Pyramimonas_sp.AAC.1
MYWGRKADARGCTQGTARGYCTRWFNGNVRQLPGMTYTKFKGVLGAGPERVKVFGVIIDKMIASMIESGAKRTARLDYDEVHDCVLQEVVIKEAVKTGPGKTFYPMASYQRTKGDFATNGSAQTEGHYLGEDENGVEGVWAPDVDCAHYGKVERHQSVRTVNLGSGSVESISQKQAQVFEMLFP